MSYFIYILFGLVPSLVWLAFYLRKDSHPESNRMILKIFFWGALITLPTAIIEMGFFEQFKNISAPPILLSIWNIFFGIALIEELMKYFVVREKVLPDSEFDEPVDAMLYMIITALGFVAWENILVLLPLGSPINRWVILEAFGLSSFRFVGATFLHALCSGIIGYFIALSICEEKNKTWLFMEGLGIAVLLHGLYNFSIMKIEGDAKFLIPLVILVIAAIFVSLGFKRLKKMKSICKIKKI